MTYCVDDDANTALVFHGTSMECRDNICNNIDWTKSGGALGVGFYVTFNPHEAKAYACRRCKDRGQNIAVIFELKISNADKIIVVESNGYKMNVAIRNTMWPNQFCLKGPEIIKKIEIKRIHNMSIDNMSHFSRYSFIEDSRAPVPCIGEHEVLIRLYDASNGVNWRYNTNWKSLKPLNEWYGVTITNNVVTSLFLIGNQLTGDLSPLKTLTNLVNLDLEDNQLTGDLSPLKTLTKLRGLSLGNNQLTGDLSPLKTLTKLRSLYIKGNRLKTDPDLKKNIQSNDLEAPTPRTKTKKKNKGVPG
jgi:hypothetical protein